ncbi:hypothetical protein ACN28C_27160 [Plantactinospora sp. WMMC1484]|uniref:hypothetical protein n=1 Tax=Plantactinospora sp. WMMC1484 TaxID=3404122 RepID=UPI003BF54450
MYRSARRRVAGLGLLLAGLLVLVPVAPTGAAATPTTEPARTAVSRPALTANGIGPYRIGVSTRTGLVATGRVINVEEAQTCAGYYYAEATGRYAGSLLLKFQGNRLVQIITTDPAIRTRAGGRVGMTLAELEMRYGQRGAVEHGKWTLRAYVVPGGGDRIIAFFEGFSSEYVHQVSSGERDRVLASFVGGDDQC